MDLRKGGAKVEGFSCKCSDYFNRVIFIIDEFLCGITFVGYRYYSEICGLIFAMYNCGEGRLKVSIVLFCFVFWNGVTPASVGHLDSLLCWF